MVSTPPKAGGSPREEAWRRWAEEKFNELTNQGIIHDTRVQAVTQAATNVGNTAANAAIAANDAIEGSKSTAPTNRLARPLSDEAYWTEVARGDRYVWQSGPNHSNSRNVSVSGPTLVLQPSADEGAEIDITSILAGPSTKRLYVRATYLGGGYPQLNPSIRVTPRLADGTELDPEYPSIEVPGAGSIVNLPTLGGVYYTVKLFREPGGGIAGASEVEIFEVIGAGDGLNISPGGILVEDPTTGEPTLEINPSAPKLDAPTSPVLATGVGSVSVRWNGQLGSLAADPPAHFSYVRAEEASALAGPYLRVGQTLNKAGDIITRPPIGETRWYRFIAVDTMNRESDPSSATSVTVEGIAMPDLDTIVTDAIEQAQTDADAALATADGKNTNYYQTDEPTGGTYKNGDTWFDTDDGNRIYVWNGTAWTDAQDADIFEALQTAQIARANSAQFIANPNFLLPQPLPAGYSQWNLRQGGGRFQAPSGGSYVVGLDTSVGAYVAESAILDAVLFDGDSIYFAAVGSTTEITSTASYSLGATAIVELYQGLNPALSDTPLASVPVGGFGEGFTLSWTNNLTSGKALTVRLRVAQTNGVDQAVAFSGVYARDITPLQNALNAANGKNKNYYQDDAPVGVDHAVGDTWFDTNNGNKISQWNGTIWEEEKLGGEAIAELSIVNAHIANTTITDAKIANLDAAKITTGFLDANRIAATSIEAGKLKAWTVAAGQAIIADATITNAKIANIDAGKVTTGFLDAARIKAGTIATNKLLVSNLTNMLDNPGFEYPAAGSWVLTAGATVGTTAPRTGTGSLAVTSGVKVAAQSITAIPVQEGERYRLSGYVRRLSGTSVSNGITLRINYGATETVGTVTADLALTPNGTGVTYVRLNGAWTVPAGAKYMKFEVVQRDATASVSYLVDDLALQKMYDGELIVDGAITASKVTMDEAFANKFWANEANFGKVTVDILEPNIGEKINIVANEGLLIVAGAADDAMNQAITATGIAGGAGTAATYAAQQAKIAQDAAAAAADDGKRSRAVFDFDTTGLHISQPGGVYSLHLNNDGITINEGDVPVSLWNAGQMIVDKFVGSEVVLANHKIESRGTRTVFRSM